MIYNEFISDNNYFLRIPYIMNRIPLLFYISHYNIFYLFIQKFFSPPGIILSYILSDLKCDSPERLTLDAELTDEAIDKGVIMEKSEASEDLAARCESILAVGRTHANEELANEDRPSSLALSVRRCLACILGLPLLPRPKCRSSKCLLRFLDWRRIAPHNGHDAGWSDRLRVFDNPSPETSNSPWKLDRLQHRNIREHLSPWLKTSCLSLIRYK